MNETASSETEYDFGLFNFLAADLRRARLLQYGPDATASGLRLWLGALSPRFAPVLLCRVAHCFYRLKLGPLAKIVSLLNYFLFGIEIAVRCPIGKGLFLPHSHGTVIGAHSVGANATIYQGVTLGARELDFAYQGASRPMIGNDVLIGSGAKVLGGIHIGDGARIGANAVVLDSIPAGVLAVGMPARVHVRTRGTE